LHKAGKTDQAKADLARLAVIRKQREDAAKKREDEKKGIFSLYLKRPNQLLAKDAKAARKK
jgi:hypothetical protein